MASKLRRRKALRGTARTTAVPPRSQMAELCGFSRNRCCNPLIVHGSFVRVQQQCKSRLLRLLEHFSVKIESDCQAVLRDAFDDT